MEQQNSHEADMNETKPGWERETLEKLVFAALNEQKTARRWNLVFKFAMLGYFVLLLGIAVYPKLNKDFVSTDGQHTAVINLVGMIAEGKDSNASDLIDSLRNAAKDKKTKGIILHANSPGGSPVQSAYVYDEIRALKKQHPNLPIYTVVSDICASGCYYIAAASDKIFVSQASIIGSIGVLMDGFGYTNGMQKLGIERRLLTAGSHKAMLDPFSPPKVDETKYMQSLLDEVHQQFISAVKAGRGDRLHENPDLFSGLVWTGERSLKLGIADDYGNDDSVAKNLIGAEKLVDFTKQEQLIERLAGKLGESIGFSFENVFKNYFSQSLR